MKTLILAAAFGILSTTASAATFSVDAKANGLFGASYSGPTTWGGTAMIAGPQLGAGETITITATGQISIGENLFVGPEGEDVDSSSGKVFTEEYTPLEEIEVEANPALANRTLMPNLGALIAAFVPEATVQATGFSATDTDLGGNITSDRLFFVGEGLTFTAPEAGSLFFGINEAYVFNNGGAYSVTTQPAAVPLPASGLLLLAAFGAAAAMGRRTS